MTGFWGPGVFTLGGYAMSHADWLIASRRAGQGGGARQLGETGRSGKRSLVENLWKQLWISCKVGSGRQLRRDGRGMAGLKADKNGRKVGIEGVDRAGAGWGSEGVGGENGGWFRRGDAIECMLRWVGEARCVVVWPCVAPGMVGNGFDQETRMTSRWVEPAPALARGTGTQWIRWATLATVLMGITLWIFSGQALAQGEAEKAVPTAGPAPAPAATPASGAVAMDALPSFVELYNTSPIINGIIIGLSVIALLLFVFFLLTINHNTIVPAPFLDDVMKMVMERDYKQAIEFCRHHRGIFISTVIQRCLENVGREHPVLMNIVDTEGKRRGDLLWNRISYLADISNVAPMLGLLGTIVGMMGAFFGLDQTSLDARSKFISGNIAGAMATTYFGLIVAIAALIFHSIIKSRLTRVLSEAEQAVHAVTDHIKRGEA